MRTLQSLMALKGRTALITGGAGHIGRAMAEALLEAGSRVLLADLKEAQPDQAAKKLGHLGQCLGWTCDISSEREIKDLVAKVRTEEKRLDIVIHSAALVGTSQLSGWATPFLEQSSDTFDRALRTNLTSAFTLVREAAPLLMDSRHGSVILVASTYGLVGPDMSLYEGTKMGNPLAYGASKAGLIQLARYLATNLSPHVRVNALTPGGVERGQPEEFQKRYRAKTPLGRMATEEDFKGAAVYLASDLSQYVTGQNLIVDGGWTCW